MSKPWEVNVSTIYFMDLWVVKVAVRSLLKTPAVVFFSRSGRYGSRALWDPKDGSPFHSRSRSPSPPASRRRLEAHSHGSRGRPYSSQHHPRPYHNSGNTDKWLWNSFWVQSDQNFKVVLNVVFALLRTQSSVWHPSSRLTLLFLCAPNILFLLCAPDILLFIQRLPAWSEEQSRFVDMLLLLFVLLMVSLSALLFTLNKKNKKNYE